jgi:hypothetical protein
MGWLEISCAIVFATSGVGLLRLGELMEDAELTPNLSFLSCISFRISITVMMKTQIVITTIEKILMCSFINQRLNG